MQDLLALVKNDDFSFQLESSNRLQFIILAVSICIVFWKVRQRGVKWYLKGLYSLPIAHE